MTRTPRIGVAAVLVGLGLLGPGAPVRAQGSGVRAASEQEIHQRIAAFDAAFDASDRLSGVLLIARGDTVILHEAFGMAHVGLSVPNRTDTRIPIASITKTMTSIALNRLLDDGVLAAGDPISKWLPDFPRGGEITIEHLARHRSGLPHRVMPSPEESLPISTAEVVERAARARLSFDPGSRSSYSSAGFTVLVRCMELASGRSYAELLRQYVLEPAGMRDTFDSLPGRELAGEASAYVPGRGELWPAPKKDLSFLAGAGSVVSTAADLWKFVHALKEGSLVIPISTFLSQGRLALTGVTSGYFAFIDTYPDDDLTCIWLGNSWGSGPGALREALPGLVRGETAPAVLSRPAALVPVPAAAALAYCGAYAARPGAQYEVKAYGGELWFADSMLLPMGPDRFWYPPWSCEIAFIRGPEGSVIAAERRDAAGTARWERTSETGP